MRRPSDLDERLDLALGARGHRAFDRSITRAMEHRRRQFLAQRGTPGVEGDTAIIQARLAAARKGPAPHDLG